MQLGNGNISGSKAGSTINEVDAVKKPVILLCQIKKLEKDCKIQRE